jgi:hypothetical protein
MRGNFVLYRKGSVQKWWIRENRFSQEIRRGIKNLMLVVERNASAIQKGADSYAKP